MAIDSYSNKASPATVNSDGNAFQASSLTFVIFLKSSFSGVHRQPRWISFPSKSSSPDPAWPREPCWGGGTSSSPPLSLWWERMDRDTCATSSSPLSMANNLMERLNQLLRFLESRSPPTLASAPTPWKTGFPQPPSTMLNTFHVENLPVENLPCWKPPCWKPFLTHI